MKTREFAFEINWPLKNTKIYYGTLYTGLPSWNTLKTILRNNSWEKRILHDHNNNVITKGLPVYCCYLCRNSKEEINPNKVFQHRHKNLCENAKCENKLFTKLSDSHKEL